MTGRHIRTAGIMAVLLGIATVLTQTPALSREVGVTSAANPVVEGTPPAAAKRVLYIGTDVFFNERVQTGENGLAQILLLDQSAFTIGRNTDVVIDEFVYDPDTSSGRLISTLTKGTLRFIGGKLSKQAGGVTINTPVVSIGVRGAIVAVSHDPEANVSTIRMDYGEEVTVTSQASGEKTTITSNSYEVTVESGESPGNPEPVTEESVAETEAALSGDTGTDGGAAESPTDDYVATTEIVQLGSDSEPDDPVVATVVLSPATSDSDTAPEDTTEAIEDTAGVDDALNDQLQDEVIDAIGPALLYGGGRYLAAGDSYTIAWGPVISNPGSVGLLGGGADTDQAITSVEISGDRLLLTLSGGFVVDLPYQLGVFAVTDATTPGGAATGTGFVADTEDFYFFQLTLDGDPDGRIVLFGGEPFDLLANPADGELNMFTIHPDAVQGLDVPFMPAYLAAAADGMAMTPLYVLEQTSGVIGTFPGGEATVLLFGAMKIDGQGADQESAVKVYVSNVWLNPDTDKFEVGAANRGSVRLSALEGPITFSGGINAIPDADGNIIFGQEGEYFVLGPEPSDPDAPLNTSFADGTPEGLTREYGVQHLVTYDSSVDRSTLQRGDRTLYMYSAGLMEESAWRGVDPMIFRTTNGDPTLSPLIFNAATNRLSAMIQVEDVLDTSVFEEYRLGFGRFPEGHGGSAYIDDDTYAAIYNKYVTTAFADGAVELSLFDYNPFTYFFTNTLIPVDGFLPVGVTFCTCAFMEWGYWGGRLITQDPEGAEGQNRHSYFHLETWIAGELPDLVVIPDSGVASYSGHAIGDVYNTAGIDPLHYLAVGNFDMDWDFAARQGTATISDFDGMTFGSDVDAIASANGREFSGLIGNVDVSGELQGSFFTDGIDPVAGVGGDFYVTGADVTAAGTFMGER